MKGHTTILNGPVARERAKMLIDRAPAGYISAVDAPRRSNQQNDKMWALLGELSVAKPDGRSLPPHKWKSIMMDAAGKKPDWERSADGESMVCVGYKSSRLTKSEMSDVIEAIYEYGARHGVQFTND